MNKFIDTGDRIIRKINSVLYYIAPAMLVGMVLNVVLAVLCNKVFKITFPIPVDYTGYLLLMVAAFGYAGYQYKNGFVRVTMLTEHFSHTAARITEVGNFLILIFFYGFLAYQCFLAGNSALVSNVKMMSISWKVYPYYYILAGGILWTTIVTLFQMIKYIVRDEL